MKTTQVNNDFGIEILNFDLRNATESDALKIRELLYQYKLVILRKQFPSEIEYLNFAKKVGTPQIYFQKNYQHPHFPEIFVASNMIKDGKKIGVAGTGCYWHSDCSFQTKPLTFTTLLPRILPKSLRQTFFVDMALVYQKLPVHLKDFVDQHEAIHEAKWRYKVRATDVDRSLIDILEDIEKFSPPVQHPCVIRHPVTKQKILYLNEGFTTRFSGMGRDQSLPILQELFTFISSGKNVHAHQHQLGDLMMWENRSLIHKASVTPHGEDNLNYRIGIYDEFSFYEKLDQEDKELAEI